MGFSGLPSFLIPTILAFMLCVKDIVPINNNNESYWILAVKHSVSQEAFESGIVQGLWVVYEEKQISKCFSVQVLRAECLNFFHQLVRVTPSKDG